jgi:hypothetical protein
MNLKFTMNEYLLVWYILYGASLSDEIHKFKQKLWKNYRNIYNQCYKDKNEIIKYDKDFIPDNDLLYNFVFESEIYQKLKKEDERHRVQLMKIWDENKKKLNAVLKELLRFDLVECQTVFVLHPYMEIVEYNKFNDSVVWGSDKDKYTFLNKIIFIIVSGMLSEYKKEDNDIIEAIIELVVLNEINTKISSKSAYYIGRPGLKIIKRQIYPYFLMYLGASTQEELLSYMMRDKIVFELEKYQIEKSLSKMNLCNFIDFCIKNKKYIIKISNMEKASSEDMVEVI